jgi:hypothetical protein
MGTSAKTETRKISRGNGKAKKPSALDIILDEPPAPSPAPAPEPPSAAANALDNALADVKLALTDSERADIAAQAGALGLQAERAYLLHMLKPEVIADVKAKDSASIVKTLSEMRGGGASDEALAPWERILAKCLKAGGERDEDEPA